MPDLENRRCFQHFRHKRRDALQLTIPSSHSREDRVKDRKRRPVGRYKTSDLSHESDHSDL